jgi:hypothetical protein
MTIGELRELDLPDGRIVLKSECACGNKPVAIVKRRRAHGAREARSDAPW